VIFGPRRRTLRMRWVLFSEVLQRIALVLVSASLIQAFNNPKIAYHAIAWCLKRFAVSRAALSQ
jgi:hypothetical protein